MRVVLDTNVFVSSFFGGPPRQIIDLWKRGDISLCFSNAVLEEYVDVLRRLKLANARELSELLGVFKKQLNCVFAAQPPQLRVSEDPDDDKFVSVAVELDAKVIVSGDRHLKSLGRYADIPILSPRDFLEKQDQIRGMGKKG